MSTQTATRERPIIFSGEMIRAILEGRKTQTRRVAKTFESPASSTGHFIQLSCDRSIETDDRAIPFCPHGQPGDRLWVRETWQKSGLGWGNNLPIGNLHYRATDDGKWKAYWGNWKSSMFMPRWASRITLEITGVRVERLQEITEEGAIAEGIQRSERNGRFMPGACDYATWAFRELWDSINAKRGFSWDSNPFVWVIEFRRIKP